MASLDRQDSQRARQHAISALKRSASKRGDNPQGSNGPQQQQQTPPPLVRTTSDSARDEAMRRLEGGAASPSPQSSPLMRSGSNMSQRPPRLSAIQRRHLEQQQQQQQQHHHQQGYQFEPAALEPPAEMDDADVPEDPQESPSFSIFTPSLVGGPAPTSSSSEPAHHAPVPPLPTTHEVEEEPPTQAGSTGDRHQTRSNLMRKLSQRDNNNPSRNNSTRSNTARYPAAAPSRRDRAPPEQPSPTETVTSDFRPYRYTMERDRDSVMAKLNHEDSFEYDQLLKAQKQKQLDNREAESRVGHQEDDEQEELDLRPSLRLEPSRSQKQKAQQAAEQHHWPTPPRDYAFPASPNSSRPNSPLLNNTSQSLQQLSLSDQTMSQPQRVSSASRDSYEDMRLSSAAHPDPRSATPRALHSSGRSSKDQTQSSHAREFSGGSQRTHGHSDSLNSSQRSLDHRSTPSASTARSSRTIPSHSHKKSKLSEDQLSFDHATPLVLHDSDHEPDAFDEDDEDLETLESGDIYPAPNRPLPTGAPPRDAILSQLETVMATAAAAQSPGSKSHQPSQGMGEPPRKLLMHAPVLQVVNAHTVKDRYLFLFNDILVISKPIVLEDPATSLIIPPSLDSKFLTKSIVELEKLKLQTLREDQPPDNEERKKHTLLVSFVDRFANDPKRAINTLIMKGGLANQPEVIANLLFRTPELNHSQMGAYLSKRDNKHVMKAYIERFRFFGVRLEDSLRCLLATLRLPNDAAAAEYLLTVFSTVWTSLNGHALGWDASFTMRLVIAIMELNDYLHSGIDDETTAMGHLFGFPNPAITVTDFIAAFRSKDPKGLVSDEVLTRIYLSIKRERLQQASDNSIMAVTPEIPVTLHPSRLPSRLTYQTMSEEITVSIPKPDPKFFIRLLGGDVRCEPSILKFDKSSEARFRISSTALGHRTLLFLKCGRHATFYTGLPINKSFSVERAFMRHTFQLSFVNHLGVKRKYMFSMSDHQLRSEWLEALRTGIDTSLATQSFHAPTLTRARQVGSSVSLQVLRDALIQQPDDKAAPSTTIQSRPGSAGRRADSTSARQRSNSFSKTYFVGMGRAESDLNKSGRKGSHNTPAANGANHHNTVGSSASTAASSIWGRRPSSGQGKPAATSSSSQAQLQQEEASSERAKTGHELVLTAAQNSNLPAILGLLSSTVSAAPHPMDSNSSAFRPRPGDWKAAQSQ